MPQSLPPDTAPDTAAATAADTAATTPAANAAPAAPATTPAANAGKFIDPDTTADGTPRARVALTGLTTLWVNTGTLCNIACTNCYIDSSPSNDALEYFAAADLPAYLDEAEAMGALTEVGFTGGEPFMNPDILALLTAPLARGLDVLVLTNAMRPMMRPRVQAGLAALIAQYGDKLTLRVSLDHWQRDAHDKIRGPGSYDETLAGLAWLRDRGASLAIAGRALWDMPEAEARAGYAALLAEHDLAIDAWNPARTVIFPEMDLSVEVPEITTACWGILGKSPADVMCASSRMLVKRKGAAPTVLACTLLAHDPAFELGTTLSEAARPVALNHPHCAKFCVLGGAACSL